MRLRDMQETLTLNLPLLDMKIEGKGANLVRVSPVDTLRSALRKLADVPGLGSRANNILRTSLISEHAGGGIVMDAPDWHAIDRELDQIKIQGQFLLTAFNAILPPANDLAIAIELPIVKSIHELKEVLDDVDLILVTLSSNKHAPTKFHNFDIGSAFIEMVPPSVQMFSFIMAVIGASTHLVRAVFRLAAEAKQYEILGLAADDIAAAMKVKQKAYDLMLEQQVKSIAKEHGYCSEGDNEQLAKLTMVINCMNDNIARGMRLLPSAQRPERGKLVAEFDAIKELPTGPLPKLLGVRSDDDKSDKNGGSSGT